MVTDIFTIGTHIQAFAGDFLIVGVIRKLEGLRKVMQPAIDYFKDGAETMS